MINTIIIGAGNVATHLYQAIQNAEGVTVSQWYNRNLKPLKAHKNETDITDDISSLKIADVYVIAISDDAISELSEKLPFSDRLVIHTSGSTSLHSLNSKNNRGVFYPLQTFTKDAQIDFSEIPFCIEIEHKSDLEVLRKLAISIGSKHYKVNSDQRAALHLAAIFVNNFVNQLYRIGQEITESKSVEFDILKPLIKETALKLETLSPYLAQTGPAKRNDKKTIKKHLRALKNDSHKAIYELMTKSIIETHGKKL